MIKRSLKNLLYEQVSRIGKAVTREVPLRPASMEAMVRCNPDLAA
jgi:hypothetical protein